MDNLLSTLFITCDGNASHDIHSNNISYMRSISAINLVTIC
uniref:Uncharacterized protein n=1 Tax=Rhizophora mucronata TaxID=61149 RepID=A0A2P2R1E1_RHIMU